MKNTFSVEAIKLIKMQFCLWKKHACDASLLPYQICSCTSEHIIQMFLSWLLAIYSHPSKWKVRSLFWHMFLWQEYRFHVILLKSRRACGIYVIIILLPMQKRQIKSRRSQCDSLKYEYLQTMSMVLRCRVVSCVWPMLLDLAVITRHK